MTTQQNQLERYKKTSKLGEGTYGEVYKAVDQQTGEIVAIKRIRLEHEEEGVPGTAIREISLLKELQHEYIVGLKAVVHQNHRLHLIFEYCELDLKKYMDKQQLPKPIIKQLFQQLLVGVNFCHCHRVLHRDLKPQNILIKMEPTPTCKIADFGLARAFGIPVRQFTHEIITLWYRPPEVLLGTRHYSTAVDVWSIACIWAEMLMNSQPLFPGDCEIDQLFKIFQVLGTPNEETWPGVTQLQDYKDSFPNFAGVGLQKKLQDALSEAGIDLMARMLEQDPVKRLSAKECLEHPYWNE
uniref:cyclin-dependent kinase n=1 Tax=Trepomonas sp. PC1 TaxID=1076344 RepID=A0A146K848_9EUKA|eukprot:JAP91721.1 Kinase, CMGC CDK [Trepomonas sp. PC1]